MVKVLFKPEQRAYRPYGTARDLLYCKEDEVGFSGPAGTGKSRGCLEKLHLCALKYAGARLLIVRKTRASLTQAALVTYEDKVLPAGSSICQGAARNQRQSYKYPNGSEIVVGGLDKAGKVMSTEYDMIYIQEAIELAEADHEALTTRLRNGVMPYQQIIFDTNPDGPEHWLKQRTNRGQTKMLESRHEDNPIVWDHENDRPTERGAVYLAKLEALTGVRYYRLRKGLWVAAEGLIYDGWDPQIHLIDQDDERYGLKNGIPDSWPRWWVIDFGYTNPFVWQAWAQDPDGRLFRYKEIYCTQRLVEDHAADILAATVGEPRPRKIICDHDAEDRATLERYLKMPTTAAHKSVSDGIQAVASRFRKAGDGKPRLFLLRDALVKADELLVERLKPTCTEQEIGGYVWDTRGGQKRGEQPLKEDDHGCDTTRYMVAEIDGLKPNDKRPAYTPTFAGVTLKRK